MFENRARKRRRNILLFTVILILASAFGFGYYLNYDGDWNVDKIKANKEDNVGYEIPSSIRNAGNSEIVANAETERNLQDDTITSNVPENLITPNTNIIFKKYFTLCSHMIDKSPEDMNEFINLSKEDLQGKYPDWTISEFSTQQVILKREIQTYCPRHYIISSKDGYIAIYVYNEDGVKTLYEMTDNPISILTDEDQRNLEYGIVADSEEELQQKLEGLGD